MQKPRRRGRKSYPDWGLSWHGLIISQRKGPPKSLGRPSRTYKLGVVDELQLQLDFCHSVGGLFLLGAPSLRKTLEHFFQRLELGMESCFLHVTSLLDLY